VQLDASRLEYSGYECRELLAEAEYEAGHIDLTRLYLRDKLGEVQAHGNWRIGADRLNFALNSTADLPSLAQAFLNNDNLRQVVFYESPQLSMQGVWHIGSELAQNKRPLQITAELHTGRLAFRGEIFQNLSSNRDCPSHAA
jgi:hypothetical protein